MIRIQLESPLIRSLRQYLFIEPFFESLWTVNISSWFTPQMGANEL